ncbi:MAG: hypothetical protein HQL69_05480 [Magnetococcales bacterium]|nr:hypothetical protein [Magnetococcales bacterium]
MRHHPVKMFVKAILILFIIITPLTVKAEPIGKMIYFKTEFCPWCKVFEQEVLGIFNLTDEGKELPIVEVTLKSEKQLFPKIEKTIPYVPTFVIIDNDGKERGRIFGYSPDFFWVKLGEIIKSIHKSNGSVAKQKKEIDPRITLGEGSY